MQHLVDAFLDFAHADASDTLEAIDPHQVLEDALEDSRRAGLTVTGRRDKAVRAPRPCPQSRQGLRCWAWPCNCQRHRKKPRWDATPWRQ